MDVVFVRSNCLAVQRKNLTVTLDQFVKLLRVVFYDILAKVNPKNSKEIET